MNGNSAGMWGDIVMLSTPGHSFFYTQVSKKELDERQDLIKWAWVSNLSKTSVRCYICWTRQMSSGNVWEIRNSVLQDILLAFYTVVLSVYAVVQRRLIGLCATFP